MIVDCSPGSLPFLKTVAKKTAQTGPWNHQKFEFDLKGILIEDMTKKKNLHSTPERNMIWSRLQ